MSKSFTHIIVPLDGSAGAELALPPAEQLALALNAVVILLRATDASVGPVAVANMVAIPGSTSSVAVLGGPVGTTEFGNMGVTPVMATPTRTPDEVNSEAHSYLHIRAQELRTSGVIVFEEVYSGNPVEAILDQARLHDQAMIVIAAHNRGNLSRLFFGSTADDLIQRSPCPVLFIRRDDDE
ncbi:MAG: universal stress protein [Oscillochloris sp.]|nr:universal stress protein [Oscillochloris sp.]